jgi:hypothetical protein
MPALRPVWFAIIIVLALRPSPTIASDAPPQLTRAYEINRKVSAFPKVEDLSTPEATYAGINRIIAAGEDGAWRRVSVAAAADRLPPADAPRRSVPPHVARLFLDAEVLEVRVFRDTLATVIARLPDVAPTPIDVRTLRLEDDRWLNSGNDRCASIHQARTGFSLACARLAGADLPPTRAPVTDPRAHLKTFIDFLERRGEEPGAFVMDALAKHRLVIMGEVHHRPPYWSFNTSLVNDPKFPTHVGVIYLELPRHAQHLVDRFLAADECDPSPVIEMLRDNLWMGWPDQPMLDFFIEVWKVNRTLEPRRRLRIVLVDMNRPWTQIRTRADWRRFEVDRDEFMAANILADMQRHGPRDPRHALFVVGVGHALLDMSYFDGTPVASAGWHLREKLGRASVLAIFPHMPVQTNWGRVDGRLCLGLFDSAFRGRGGKPVAFALRDGPFGREPFDAFPDRPVTSTFADGYDAYLYLGPLEGEVFSPLIDGFYTDEFVKELDRRYRMESNQSLVQGCGLPRLDAESFVAWMSRTWGRPREAWSERNLGPLDAWRHGGRSWRNAGGQ